MGVVKMDNQEDLIRFIMLKERLLCRLVNLQRVQKLQLEMLDEVSKVAHDLGDLQFRHRDWKLKADNVQLLKDAGMWGKLHYSSLNGNGLR